MHFCSSFRAISSPIAISQVRGYSEHLVPDFDQDGAVLRAACKASKLFLLCDGSTERAAGSGGEAILFAIGRGEGGVVEGVGFLEVIATELIVCDGTSNGDE